MQRERSSTGSLRVQSDGERIDREQVEAAIRHELPDSRGYRDAVPRTIAMGSTARWCHSR